MLPWQSTGFQTSYVKGFSGTFSHSILMFLSDVSFATMQVINVGTLDTIFHDIDF